MTVVDPDARLRKEWCGRRLCLKLLLGWHCLKGPPTSHSWAPFHGLNPRGEWMVGDVLNQSGFEADFCMNVSPPVVWVSSFRQGFTVIFMAMATLPTPCRPIDIHANSLLPKRFIGLGIWTHPKGWLVLKFEAAKTVPLERRSHGEQAGKRPKCQIHNFFPVVCFSKQRQRQESASTQSLKARPTLGCAGFVPEVFFLGLAHKLRSVHFLPHLLGLGLACFGLPDA